jgi:hypothetical protein
MKKITTKASLFLGALLLSGVCFSASGDKEDIARHCESMGNQLGGMAENTNSDPCAFDVKYSGWLIKGTSILVRSERFHYGLDNLKQAKGRLEKVYLAPQKCRYLSPEVKPYLAELEHLINELDWISN